MKKFLLVCGVCFCAAVGYVVLSKVSPETTATGKDKARGAASSVIDALP